MAHNFVSTPFSVRYVRLSTRLTEKGVLSRSASKYSPRARKAVLSPSGSESGFCCRQAGEGGCPRASNKLDRASPNTLALFRRRSNEQHERDVLRHDARLFGVEPLTNAHSFGDVFEPDENFFEDGLTRRSAKLAPWANFRPRLQVAAR